MRAERPVLLTGATGFVGRHLRIALESAGYVLRLGTRRPEAMRAQEPSGDWVHVDVDRPQSVQSALAGCAAAYYLVHQVGTSANYAATEVAAARVFSQAADSAGLERVVYLGGVAPSTVRSRHLKSRRQTGVTLRAARTPCVELRAGMIIGHGSLSWQMVSELAHRLPAMILPRWLANHSWPVGIDDVVYALVSALRLETKASLRFDLPGAERISHRELLLRVARQIQRKPVMVGVPVLSPRLSSYWIGLVTSVELGLARELVEGLVTDLDPDGDRFWDAVPRAPQQLDEAISAALADEAVNQPPSEATRRRMAAIGAGFAHEPASP